MGLYITLSSASICISTSPSASASQSPPRPSSAVCIIMRCNALCQQLPRLTRLPSQQVCPGLSRPVPCCPTLPCRGILGGATFLVPACLVSRIKQFSAWFALFACACPFSSLRSPFSPSVSTSPSPPPPPPPYSIIVANRPTAHVDKKCC